GLHFRRGPAARISLRAAGAAGHVNGQPLRGRHQYIRAQLHPPGVGEVRVERHWDLRVPWNTVEHSQVQDGQARRTTAREAVARRLTGVSEQSTPANNLAGSAKVLPLH